MTYLAKDLADAAGIKRRDRKYVLCDEYGLTYDVPTWDGTLVALGRADKTPDLDANLHTVAYATRKAIVTGRTRPEFYLRVMTFTPYQVCELVAKVANECAGMTIGEIADTWLPQNAGNL